MVRLDVDGHAHVRVRCAVAAALVTWRRGGVRPAEVCRAPIRVAVPWALWPRGSRAGGWVERGTDASGLLSVGHAKASCRCGSAAVCGSPSDRSGVRTESRAMPSASASRNGNSALGVEAMSTVAARLTSPALATAARAGSSDLEETVRRSACHRRPGGRWTTGDWRLAVSGGRRPLAGRGDGCAAGGVDGRASDGQRATDGDGRRQLPLWRGRWTMAATNAPITLRSTPPRLRRGGGRGGRGGATYAGPRDGHTGPSDRASSLRRAAASLPSGATVVGVDGWVSDRRATTVGARRPGEGWQATDGRVCDRRWTAGARRPSGGRQSPADGGLSDKRRQWQRRQPRRTIE